jgi:hypothetical protein
VLSNGPEVLQVSHLIPYSGIHALIPEQLDSRESDQTTKKYNPSLEQDLATMLGLEAQSLQLVITLLIALFPLILFFLLQFENFLERSLGHGGGNVVFAVEVLNELSISICPVKQDLLQQVPTYHFA